MSSIDDPSSAVTRGHAISLGLGVVVPLAVIALAWALFTVSDRLLYIGPLDRARFGWGVVIPIWMGAPVVAGFLWRDLTVSRAAVAAMVVGATVTLFAAVLLWQGVSSPQEDCENVIRQPIDYLAPSIVVGLVIGAGVAANGLFTRSILLRGRRWRAVLFGAGIAFALVFGAILVASWVQLWAFSCGRPL